MSIEIELGDIAKDTITGFKGVVIGITKWLHGCRRMTLQPQELGKEGKPIDSMSFDEPQLEFISKRSLATTSETGGPRPEPTRSETPQR